MSKESLVILGVAIFQVICVVSFNLTITPDFLSVTNYSKAVTFTCSADVALTGCQFRLRDVYFIDRARSSLLDLSQGSESRADPAHLDTHTLTGYSYSGRGLENGDCGITLNIVGQKLWMVACRVRANTGGWKYAWAELYAWNGYRTPHTLTPREAVVLPGQEARFTLRSEEPLDWCIFYLGGANEGITNSSRDRYQGAGLQNGECGLALADVTEADNGPVNCGFQIPGWINVRRIMALIVADPPTAPTLNLVYTGTNLTATCDVQGGRPVANITWLIGNDVVRQDDVDDFQAASADKWKWPWNKSSMQQVLTISRQTQHIGKELKCRVSHIALDQPLESKQLIAFTAAPASTCPPLTSDTVLITCSVASATGRERGTCSQPQEIGTEARLACKPGFAVNANVVYRKLTCLSSGKWNRPVFTCHPDCGRRNVNDGATLSAGGKEGKKGEFPWHIGIYETMPGTQTPAQICGGTLITSQIVVTAAHCFWNASIESKKDVSNYKVAAGKHLRAWDDPDPGVQKRNVSQIVLHELFRGRNTDFASDIGFLRLDSPFEINTRVNLVCVDWDNILERRQLRAGAVGVVAGWGYTEDGVQSDTLKYVELPFILSATCLDSLPRHQQKLLTPDKICAGYVNRSTSVCGGDSGGGLVFLQLGTDKYYLRGIVSTSFKPFASRAVCYAQHYTAFTRLSHYITWIQDYIE